MDTARRLVVGLGNPGPAYRGTRHNVGFEVVEHLALREGELFGSPHTLAGYDGPANFRVARLHDVDALLVEPETFMNLSGEAVGPLVAWAGIGPEDLLVVFDDLDLPVGTLRLRPHGGSGGQKGMTSIIETLRTDRFPRLRVGIGRSGTAAARHVLATFPPAERELVDRALPEAAAAIHEWLRTGDLDAVMTRFHSRWRPREGPEPGTPATEEE